MNLTPFFRKCSLIFLCLFISFTGYAQDTRGYELLPYPDVWYNDVDGIRVGSRVIGQVPGTFEDGPHRLNAGFWVGTWWPDTPVSYYLEFTEPIPSISGFNSEGNLQLVSSIRTGVSRHGFRFNKRWQSGFDELEYIKITVGFSAQQRFDFAYAHYPAMWQQEWLWIGNTNLELNNHNSLGRYQVRTELAANILGKASPFIQSRTELRQQIDLGNGFQVRGRLFAGVSSEQIVPEYRFGRSFLEANRWLSKSLVRAKGTIPAPWMETGAFQIAGGANLRGYSRQDITALEDGQVPILTSIGSVNIELDYPNPLDRAIQGIPTIGKLMKLRSYIFGDAGTSLGLTQHEEEKVLSDAGIGFMFSLNIPDFLGNPRGLMLRYDIPLWLSNPMDGNRFSYRGIVGVGAIFEF